jgi:hypothetical protein
VGENVIGAVKNRIYQNYMMNSRVPVFRELLKLLGDAGYKFLTVNELVSKLQSPRPLPDKTAVIRCDVDSDIRTAMLMLEVASQQNAVMSWYWRLSTLNPAAMLQMAHAGHENGYHFEELATVAKREGISTKEDIERLLPAMRDAFCRNIEDKYAQAAGSLPRTIASHGDFANRLLKQDNSIVVDATIRVKYGIVADISHDNDIWSHFTRIFSDVEAPHWWVPSSPLVAPPSGPDVTYILVHPRQYHARIVANTMLDVERALEAVAYSLRRRLRFYW